MSERDLVRKIKLLRELQRTIEEAQTEAEALKDEIKAHMGDSEELRAGGYKITWQAVTTHRIDTAALKKAMPAIAESFTRATTSRRFTVA